MTSVHVTICRSTIGQCLRKFSQQVLGSTKLGNSGSESSSGVDSSSLCGQYGKASKWFTSMVVKSYARLC